MAQNLSSTAQGLISEYLPATEIIKLTDQKQLDRFLPGSYDRILKREFGYQNYLQNFSEQKNSDGYTVFKQIYKGIMLPRTFKTLKQRPLFPRYLEEKFDQKTNSELLKNLLQADEIEFFFENNYSTGVLTTVKTVKDQKERIFHVVTPMVKRGNFGRFPFADWLNRNSKNLRAQSIEIGGDYGSEADVYFIPEDEDDDRTEGFTYKKVILPPYKPSQRSKYLNSVGFEYWYQNRDGYNPQDFKGLTTIKVFELPDFEDFFYASQEDQDRLDDFLDFIRQTGVQNFQYFLGSGLESPDFKRYIQQRLPGVRVVQEL